VVDGVESELDLFASEIEDRVLAQIQPDGGLSVALLDTLCRGVRAAVRDALTRLRTRSELPRELPPDLLELARVQTVSQGVPPDLADAWLVGQEVFWSRFALVAEQRLDDTALRWEVIKVARLQLSGTWPA
jgi:hypothetical protein